MTDTAERDLDETFVDLLLEEHFEQSARAAPSTNAEEVHIAPAAPTSTKAARVPVAAAVLLGVVVVVATVVGFDPAGERRAAQDPDQKSMRAAAYFPLRVGDRWRYRETISDVERELTVATLAARDADGRRVVQLATLGGDEPTFAFWSADERGVCRHTGTRLASDPLPATRGIRFERELPGPIGAHHRWSFVRVLGEQTTPGVRVEAGARRTDAQVDYDAELVSVDEQVDIDGRQWRCVHVRARSEDGARTEDLFYARGVGLVREVIVEQGEPARVRELLRFEQALPTPDRASVLDARPMTESLVDASTAWLDMSANADAAWNVRSEFAVVTAGDSRSVFRLFGEKVVTFDPEDIEDFAALAADEGFAARVGGLSTQRMTMALGWLRWRLHEMVTGERYTSRNSGIMLRGGVATATMEGTMTGSDGARPVVVTAELTGGVPTRVDIR